MHRRDFITAVGSAVALTQLSCGAGKMAYRRTLGKLNRVGLQLYSLRDDARVDLERTLADIASIGYKDVELLGSMNNFGMAPARLREVLDRNGLQAPSTHVSADALKDLQRQITDAKILGHKYIVVASLPIAKPATLEDYRRWADILNAAGRTARERGIWLGFHNHADDFVKIDGQVAYDVLDERLDPDAVRLQLDTGNAAMAGYNPLDYMDRFGDRSWLFHIKDVPQLGAKTDTELGQGVIKWRAFLDSIPAIDDKEVFVEQETYPGRPIDSIRRDFEYISKLEF
jgi:sugar phosphate isomerase/epimerase